MAHLNRANPGRIHNVAAAKPRAPVMRTLNGRLARLAAER